jgi:O-antigen/teichoic acid export membrane protein
MIRQTTINLASVVGGETLLRVANFVAVVVMARLYGSTLLGTYATMLAYVTVVAMAADNGLQTAAVTEISGHSGHENQTITTLYVTKAFLLVPAMLLVAVICRMQNLTREAWIIAGFVAARQVVQSFGQLQMAVLKAIGRMVPIGAIQAVECLFFLLGTGITYHFKWPIEKLLLWLLTGQVLELVLSMMLIRSDYRRPCRISAEDCFVLLRRYTPIGITYGLAGLILRMDVIVLSVMASAEVVGRFAAAHIVLGFGYVVSWLFGTVLLPDMVKLAPSAQEFRRYVSKWSSVIFCVTVPGSLMVLLAAPRLMPLVYGRGFAETGRLLAVLVLAVPFVFNNSLYSNRAIALGNLKFFFAMYLGTAVLGFVLGVSLCWGFGAMGVAIAIVIREAAMFTGFRVLAPRTSPSDLRVDAGLSEIVTTSSV